MEPPTAPQQTISDLISLYDDMGWDYAYLTYVLIPKNEEAINKTDFFNMEKTERALFVFNTNEKSSLPLLDIS